ncbi:hypothetical protein BgiMline_011450, partial [Biomphalaria glabrata]
MKGKDLNYVQVLKLFVPIRESSLAVNKEINPCYTFLPTQLQEYNGTECRQFESYSMSVLTTKL